MANFRAIAATGKTLAGLIQDRYPRDEFGPSLDVQLYQTRDFEGPMRDGFSVFLYRVAINGSVRNLTYRRTPDGRRFRPSLPLDLYYMITPWAQDTERQYRMLGWAMRMLEDVGQLSASHLNHYVAETDTFTPTESVDIICDPLALNDYFTLWDRLKTLPPSATYVLRMVLIDSDVSITEGPPVQTRRFEMGEVTA
ncbi:MAG: DUF4255 domain-containing protein [Bradyrhizobium sp.]